MEVFDAGGVTGIVWRRVSPEREAEVEVLMRELIVLCRKSAGYLGSEIFPPIAGVQDAYVVLYRYNSGENLRRWLASPGRSEVLGHIEPYLLQPSFECFFSHRRQVPGTASTVIAFHLRKSLLAEFMNWRTRIAEATRKWEGFLGTESFNTLDSADPEFIVVVRFDTRAHLNAWLHSDVRAKFMEEVQDYIRDFQMRRIGTGFEGWFDYSPDTSPPVAWRQGLLILSALFPVIMILRQISAPVFHALPFPVAFLLLLIADLSVLTFFVMPRYSRFMSFWLRPAPGPRWRKELTGLAIIIGLIGLTLTIALVA